MKASRIVVVVGTLLVAPWLLAAIVSKDEDRSERPYGMEKRVPWTTSKITGTPDPPPPYRTELAFPNLKFDNPLAMTNAPGTDRLFVAEQYGRVYSFPNDRQAERAELLLDLNEVLGRTTPETLAIYGLAFHPQFPQNGYVYVTYVLDTVQELPQGTRVSRFQVSRENPFRCDPKSEQILLEWPSGGHNGGCLKFGPDGYLYIGTGDSAGIADLYLTAQDLSVLPGSILRIDVDHPSEDKPYSIPKDNPFLEVEGARPEIWAYGLRQPWKMSFDRQTGELWTGNVGQDLWEQIYLIQRGGNYGWSIMEGSYPFRPERKRGPTPILMPIVEHSHAEFRSVTGGFVYRGSRLKELFGAYIYGDYDTGKIWMLRYDGQQVTEHKELVDSNLRLVGFAEDNDGELYLVDHMGGRIHQLAPNPSHGNQTDYFPRKLSETGLFKSVKDHIPAPGVIPYSVMAPQWVDGAQKERLLALPGTSQIEFDAITYPQPAPGAPAGWKFPDGTVLVETLSLEMEQGKPASRRRLETRILHHERLTGDETVGDQVWHSYTYIWNEDQTDATLLEDPQGLDRTYTILDPAASGGKRQQTWHFPSRAECVVCHNMAAKYALGLQTLQMNKDHDYGSVVANQLRTLEHIGIFTEPLPAPPEELPRLVDYRDETEDFAQRARSYLHANCSHCHRKWGGGNADFQLLATLELSEMGIADVRPTHGAFLIPDAQILAASDPYRSALFYRMAKLGPGRMPRIGSNVVDEQGLRLIRNWIAQLGVKDADPDKVWSLLSSRNRIGQAMQELFSSTSQSDRAKLIDQLLASTESALSLMWAIDEGSLADRLREEIIARASEHPSTEVRDLFERFLPEEKRTKRLGSVINPDEILALPGNAGRGQAIFFEKAGVACKSCHRVGSEGGDVGPDLSQIGKKYSRAQLLETILEPSKQIEPEYMAYLAETKRGQVYSGLLVKRDTDEVILKDAENQLIHLPAEEVDRLAPEPKSLMPELLLRDMTASEVADLLEYLISLR